MADAVHASGVFKSYGASVALAGLNLTIPSGGVFGLLGPNGAGKTTFLRILMGLVRADAGEVTVLGSAPKPGARAAGYIDAPRFHPFLTGQETLEGLARLAGTRCDPRELLGRVGLAEAAGVRVSAFSLGMKQRLAIATALIGRPQLMVLDEPLNGLDPAGIIEIRELIQQLGRQEGVTILMSSHLLDEVERVCDRVAIIKRGACVREGKVRELVAGEGRLRLHVEPLDLALRTIGPMARLVGGRVELEIGAAETPALLKALCSAGADVYEACRQRQTLEALFLEETGG